MDKELIFKNRKALDQIAADIDTEVEVSVKEAEELRLSGQVVTEADLARANRALAARRAILDLIFSEGK